MRNSSLFSGEERDSELLGNLLGGHETSEWIEEFLVLMAACHTVIPEDKGEGEIFYNASSPDEKALVEGAAR